MKKLIAIVMTLIMAFAVTGAALAAETPVNFKTSSTQISVTLPTSIVGTVDWTTGTITFGGASIVNTSVFPIHIDTITCTAETGWTLAATGGSTADTIVATVKTDVADTTPAQVAVSLLTSAQTTPVTYWDMAAGATLGLTLEGAIENADDMTAALTGIEAKAFGITFTAAAGAQS